MSDQQDDPKDLEGPFTFERFCAEQMSWSAKQFGSREQRGPIGPIRHLQKEIEKEILPLLEKNPGQIPMELFEELIDCFFLIMDAAWRSGMSPEAFLQCAFFKLRKNKRRKWGAFNATGPTEHIRGEHD